MNKKKCLAFVVLLISLFSLTACSPAKESAEGFLNSLVEKDFKKMKTYCSEEAKEKIDSLEATFTGVSNFSDNFKIKYSDLMIKENENDAYATFKLTISLAENVEEIYGNLKLKNIDGKWMIVALE